MLLEACVAPTTIAVATEAQANPKQPIHRSVISVEIWGTMAPKAVKAAQQTAGKATAAKAKAKPVASASARATKRNTNQITSIFILFGMWGVQGRAQMYLPQA
jgi:hypothetical protein